MVKLQKWVKKTIWTVVSPASENFTNSKTPFIILQFFMVEDDKLHVIPPFNTPPAVERITKRMRSGSIVPTPVEANSH